MKRNLCTSYLSSPGATSTSGSEDRKKSLNFIQNMFCFRWKIYAIHYVSLSYFRTNNKSLAAFFSLRDIVFTNTFFADEI